MTRFVLYSEDYGVYLGSCMGLGFWSKLDPVGQTMAPTFPNEQAIEDHLAEIEHDGNPRPPNTRAVEVPTDGDYVSIGQCAEAGLPTWKPDEERTRT